MKKITLIGCLLVFLFMGNTASAQQGLMYGFKAGMNFSTFTGPSEMASDGSQIESSKFASGFAVGGKIMYSFTDEFGVGGELLYSQKNARYRYEGTGYQVFEIPNISPIYTDGPTKILMSVQNSYVDLPLYLYYDIGKTTRFRISGGFNIGFLATSGADGEMTFTGENPEVVDKIIIDQNFNFFKDGPGEISDFSTEAQDINTASLGVLEGIAPTNIGAYYFFEEKDRSYFNLFELGTLVDLSMIVGNGLNIGVRGNYSLNDITNNYYDFSRQSATFNADTNSYEIIPRTDKDGFFTIHVHIGFNF